MGRPDRVEESLDRLNRAVEARRSMIEADADHWGAMRLFNGFTEGNPTLLADLYARTLLLQNYADLPGQNQALLDQAQKLLLAKFPWITCALVKTRRSPIQKEQLGIVSYGGPPADRIVEAGVWYALDLTRNRDTSFYLDTRELRRWAHDNLRGKTMLNTFAYTGSLGVAAAAGGASQVKHVDQSRQYLNLARQSCALNSLTIRKDDFISGDFWVETGKMRRLQATFDCVILDPPFFASSPRGQIDLEHQYNRLLRKVRPLVADGGWLVVVNNALFLSGQDYLRILEGECKDGYLSLEQTLPVPADVAGYAKYSDSPWPSNPHPFNHPTKIAILKVRRKPADVEQEPDILI